MFQITRLFELLLTPTPDLPIQAAWCGGGRSSRSDRYRANRDILLLVWQEGPYGEVTRGSLKVNTLFLGPLHELSPPPPSSFLLSRAKTVRIETPKSGLMIGIWVFSFE